MPTGRLNCNQDLGKDGLSNERRSPSEPAMGRAARRMEGVKTFQPLPRNREQVVTNLALLRAHNRVVICAGIGSKDHPANRRIHNAT